MKNITLEEIRFLIGYQRLICESSDDVKRHYALYYLLGIENALGGISKDTVEEYVSKIESEDDI